MRFLPWILVAQLITCSAWAAEKPTADDVAKLSALLDQAHVDEIHALNTITKANEEAHPKIQEVELWRGELVKLMPAAEEIANKVHQHNIDAQVVDQKVDTHNAGCEGEVPQAVYDRCKGEEHYLQHEIDRVREEMAQLAAERNDLQQRVGKIQTRRDQLVGEIGMIKQRADAAAVDLNTARQRVAALTARLRTACKDLSSPEGMSYCGQIDWDGARAGVPAPDLQPRPFTVEPR